MTPTGNDPQAQAETKPCSHQFVWPNGDCIDCGVLATTMPVHTAPIHQMVPRYLLALVEQRRELLKALKALISHPPVLEALAPRESLGSLLAQAEAAIAKAVQP